jgi:two-component system capsular synthesis response regulator RcsB
MTDAYACPDSSLNISGDQVLIMEPCLITAHGIRDALAQTCYFTGHVNMASKLAEVVPLIHEKQPRLLIMELCGEEETVLDGIRLVSYCIERWPQILLVVCTGLNDPRILQLLSVAGVKGLVLKQEPSQALAQCVKKVLAGDISFSHKTSPLLTNMLGNGKALSKRELDVLVYLFSGQNVTSVAAVMHRDIRTISTHKRNAMHKLGFQHDWELFAHGKWMGLPGAVFPC